MAVYRISPKCSFCGEAYTPIYEKQKESFRPFVSYGDSFVGWDYDSHKKCKTNRSNEMNKRVKVKKEEVVVEQEEEIVVPVKDDFEEMANLDFEHEEPMKKSKPKPNDPCPCGSGKLFKACCMIYGKKGKKVKR